MPMLRKKLTGHTDTVSSLDVCMERRQFYSGSNDGSVRVWQWSETGEFRCARNLRPNPDLATRPPAHGTQATLWDLLHSRT